MKDITPRNRVWVKPTDQMDVWLDTQGFYRKHTARDGTCLFRAVSEQIFLTQAFHLDVRQHIMDYVQRHPEYFQKLVTCPLIEYVDRMRNHREWGGKVEIEAMALMYRYEFLLYQEIGKPPELVTNFGFDRNVILCYSQERHYDSVYTKDYISTAAYCQSIIYDMLYKRVFDLKEVDYAVNKMLHDKTSRYQRDHLSLLNPGFALRFEMRDSYTNVKDLLDLGITPFPYKVAKSLDPEVYRNVEYDTWNDYRKGLRYGLCVWNCRELQVGVKCLVKFNDSSYHGHIQDMEPNKGPVMVFIEELGEKMTVPYESLELLPPPSPSPPVSTRSTTLPFKLQPVPVQVPKPDNSNVSVKKTLKCVVPNKLKDGIDIVKISKSSKDHSRDSQSPQTPVVTSSGYYEQEIEYQQEGMDVYHQHEYIAQRCDGNSMECEEVEQACADSTTQVRMETNVPPLGVTVEQCHYPQYTTQPHHPTSLNLSISDPNNNNAFQPAPITVNLMAPKSHSIDGSDLPHSGNIPTLRFFYNLGLDHLRMNCVLRPSPPYYLNPGILPPGYVTIDNSGMQSYEQNVITTPVVEQRRTDYLPGPMVASPSSESEESQITVPPRFKNKLKQSNAVKRSSHYEGAPLIQACEVSSSNIGMSLPVPPVYYPPPPVECEQYCMPVSYVDYGMYDYSPVYPTPTTHAYTPSSYVTPEGLIYQSILPPGVVPNTPTM